eukprot:124759_1
MFVLTLSLLVSFGCSLDVHQWKTAQLSPSTISTLFQESNGAFIAKQKDSIFILGGHLYSPGGTTLLEFDTISHSFISHSNTYDFGAQNGQSSTQIGHELFMLPENNQNIAKLNLNTLETAHITTFPGDATLLR